ncbi:MAG: Assymetric_cell_division_FstX [uncultured Acidimicrobiales bacterium]|uniref:Cell division protein FtsX n=1 Tax=uncultured Acidimicrobiales bacterium TaxID=310071 RepID=A0A6J4I1K6_9ACTN|nr:MAG: Assymetric_cell_division_FstX [uncultured Acidimicrobiales bacterium]
MAISLSYLVRETGSNLRRNLLMTAAAVLTVAVSLSLVGTALLVKQSVSKATLRWEGGVELSIFMRPDAAKTQLDAVDAELAAMPQVRSKTFVDQKASHEEFKRMFANSPEMADTVVPEDLPPSYRVVPQSPEQVEVIGRRFEERMDDPNDPSGLHDVVYAKDTIERLVDVTSFLQRLLYGIAGVLLLSSALLILNTIRMAIFSRRREVAVMKLVGATNWFIRVPFMLEGLIQGLIGAAVAFAVVAVGSNVATNAMQRDTSSLFRDFVITTSDVYGTGLFILLVGAGVGAIGSAIAVSRFLDA